MEKTTQATARLTASETYARHAAQVRRNAAIERQRVEVRADIERLQALYTQGAPRKAPVAVAPQFKEAAAFTTTHLPGGLKASAAADRAASTRRARSLDMSEEAVAKREKRRQRRLARKARQAAAQG
jgi:hypothetical protein